MEILPPLDIKPFAASSADTSALRRAWEREGGRAVAESDRMRPAIAAARRGGVGVAGEGRAVAVHNNDVVRGVGSSRPVDAARDAGRAVGSGPGVSSRIRDAERHAFDPRADPGTIAAGRAEGDVRPDANRISNGGRNVGRQAPAADELERRI